MKRFLVLLIAIAAGSIGLGLVGAGGASVAASSTFNTGGMPILATSPHAGLPTVSLNWSGYATLSSNGKPFTYVHAEFTEPTLTCDGKPYQWTSNWVGLDGFTDGTVEQDGTFANCGGKNHMTPRYLAWYEMYPAGSVVVFAVHPGDLIDASVGFAAHQFTLTVSDLSTHRTSTTTAACKLSVCTRSSAEWIIERPALCNPFPSNCFITPLADFGTTAMQSATAQLAGSPATGIDGFPGLTQIFMVQPQKNGGFYTLDLPGPVDPSTLSFPVKFLASGGPVHIVLSSRH
jgi:hypothetical protein